MAFTLREPQLPVQSTSTVLIATNPVLKDNQIAYETDTNRTKSGDGLTAYTDLTYGEFAYEIVEAAGTDTYTGNFAKPFFLAYFPLQRIRVRFTNANTGASTINLNGLGAIAIKKNVSTALASGDIIAGSIHHLYYDGTNFQIENGVTTSAAIPTLAQVLAAGNDGNNLNITNLRRLTDSAAVISVDIAARGLKNNAGAFTLSWQNQELMISAWSYDANYAPFSGRQIPDAAWVLSVVGTGTVSSVSVVTNQGVSGSVANPTTTPAITLTLGALTGVTSFNGLIITANTGVITTGTWNATVVGTQYGGTGANNTAATVGAIAYYSSSTVQTFLAATATAGQMLRSGASAAPTWSTATFPATATATGTILRADGTNWVATTNTYPNTTAINQILFATSANVIGGSTTLLSDGTFLVVGNTALLNATDVALLYKNQNAATVLFVANNTSGTAARSAIAVTANNGTTNLVLSSNSALYTTSGIDVQNSAIIYSSATAGLQIGTTSNTAIGVWTNNTQKAWYLANGQIGFGVSPSTTFEVQGSTNDTLSRVKVKSSSSGTLAEQWLITTNNDENTYALLRTTSTGFTTSGLLVAQQASLEFYSGNSAVSLINVATNSALAFCTNGTERMRLMAVGNLKIAGTAVRATTEGTNHLDIFDGTAPVGTLANGVSLHSLAGVLKSINAAGLAGFVNVSTDGAAAPATAAIGIILDYFGTSATRVLTTPNSWEVVTINGVVYKRPLYT